MIPAILPRKASIETGTTCNHACQYCPVSEYTAPHQVMDLPLFSHVMDELASLGRRMKRISFNHYNEPLVDPHLVERVRLALSYDFFDKILFNSNLSIVGRQLPEQLQFARERIEFNVNLPTDDPKRYQELHGKDHLKRVTANIQRLRDAGYSVKINIQSNNLVTAADQDSVRARYAKVIPIESIPSTSRGGVVKSVINSDFDIRGKVLAGCVQDRPTDYVHVGVEGEVFLCCQDYFKRDRLGDLNTQSLREILTSDIARRYLEYIYGGRPSPADFICNRCEMAMFREEAGSATSAAGTCESRSGKSTLAVDY